MNIIKQILTKIRLNRLEKQVEKLKKSTKPALLIGAPLYWNVGDLAIAEAEHIYFDKCFGDFDLIDIPRELWNSKKASIIKLVDANCPVFITGGGFIGDIWIEEQVFIEDILDTFTKNTIIFFPQTVFFIDESQLKKFMKKVQKVKKVLFCLREKKSFNKLIEYQSDNIKFLLVPDIVLSLESNGNNERNDECILCFRNDKEKVASDFIKRDIIHWLQNNNLNYCEFSTVYPKYVSIENRRTRVKETLNLFSKAKFVITDRLHGLILAIITGTPVLFFDNLTKKVSLTADFLRELEVVCDYESYDSLDGALNDLLNKSPRPYSSKYLDEYYLDLKNNIDNYCRGIWKQ